MTQTLQDDLELKRVCVRQEKIQKYILILTSNKNNQF
jgi:hypothetical protein